MNIFEAIILGIVQGFTEWFPISSSGHIFLVENFFSLKPDLELAIWLHIASLFAVLIYFHKDILILLKGFLAFVMGEHKNEDGILALKIGVSTLFSIPVAVFVEKIGLFEHLSLQFVAITLLITAGFIIFSEYYNNTQTKQFSWKVAIFLGLVQGVAVVPGISRAGLTIAFMLVVGIKRAEAVTISFLLAIPTIIGAAIFALSDFTISNFSFSNPALIVSFIVAFLASLLGIHFMRNWIQSIWIWFAPYCLVLAGILILL